MRTLLAILLLASTALGQTFTRPFTSNSFWNMPIQDGADIVASGISESSWFLVFEEYIVNESLLSGTLRDVREKTSETYCTSNVTANVWYTLRLPDSYTMTTKGDGNGIAAWVETDNATVPGRLREGYMWQRCTASGVAAQLFGGTMSLGFAPSPGEIDDYTISSIGRARNHSHGTGAWEAGSIGGVIREGELTSSPGVFPRHALRVVIENQFNYSDGTRGFRWPAINEDSYHAALPPATLRYHSTNPNMRLGALLTFNRGVTPATLGLITEPAKKIFWALYYYGAYTVDSFGFNSGFGSAGFCIQKRHSGSGGNTVEDEVLSTWNIDLTDAGGAPYNTTETGNFHSDIETILNNLKVVANASSEWPKGPPLPKARVKNSGLSLPGPKGAQLLQLGDRKNPTQL